jgi:hypothetical protein
VLSICPVNFTLYFFELLRGLLIDAGGDELLLAARKRLLQGALHGAVGDADAYDLPIFQQLLIFAVGDDRDLAGGRDEVLDHEDGEDCRDRVAEVETRVVVHDLVVHDRTPGARPRRKPFGTFACLGKAVPGPSLAAPSQWEQAGLVSMAGAACATNRAT